ncbi:hypothetical protein ACFQ0M_48050 [Kitasatospora aburaviensis]|uniref:Uncharacterized protein n=1 Tax=Kitasatospora aburaviensis TaxID=67265 RepID=A0ABW1EZ14_9ACTN
MATNSTNKNPLTVTEQPAAATEQDAPPVVGPPLATDQEPEKVRLAHHLVIAGRDYLPGAEVLVSPDYARQLRVNGYVAREPARR